MKDKVNEKLNSEDLFNNLTEGKGNCSNRFIVTKEMYEIWGKMTEKTTEINIRKGKLNGII